MALLDRFPAAHLQHRGWGLLARVRCPCWPRRSWDAGTCWRWPSCCWSCRLLALAGTRVAEAAVPGLPGIPSLPG